LPPHSNLSFKPTEVISFNLLYAPIHGIVCVGLCVFGILTNIVHVIVLTRPTMRNSAVNCLLTAVAICDIGTMASYLIYIVHFVVQRRTTCTPTFTYGWMQFLLWHVMLSITLHTTSLWLAVAMAFIRRMTLRVTRLNSSWQRPQFAWKLCTMIYVCVFTMSIPSVFVHEISVYEASRWEPGARCASFYPANYTQTIYTFTVSKEATANNCSIFKLNIWMIGIVFKVIPCILLVILSLGLVNKIRDAERNRRKLTNVSMNNLSSSDKWKSDRTTTMLVAILSVFLITELPQGIISILCAIYTADAYLIFYITFWMNVCQQENTTHSEQFQLHPVAVAKEKHQQFWVGEANIF
uniref:G_PROTEIN_RECEP_F1_2 domain-containing protein n=1 Tax=Angiostrongylus cantonensis TaxID=6313 RepID=A0A0K0CXM3_ANGCA